MVAPLEDPSYVPAHPPTSDRVTPDVVAKWGPRSQLRWFVRFRKALRPRRPDWWARFYCSSVQHRGLCCDSCLDDYDAGYDEPNGDRCCCRSERD
jgi:hypothetical protein